MLPESQALFSICVVCNNYANSAIITRAQLPASILVFGFFWLFLKVSLAFLGPGNLATLTRLSAAILWVSVHLLFFFNPPYI